MQVTKRFDFSAVIGVTAASLSILALVGLAARARQPMETKTNRIPLITGKYLTPTGKQTEVGSFPVNMVLSIDGKYAIVTNSGSREYVTALRVTDGSIVSQIEYNAASPNLRGKTESLYYGLAWGKEESGKRELFVSRGADEAVAVLTLDNDGKLEDTKRRIANPSGLPPELLPFFVAGLATDSTGSKVYAVNNTANPIQGMKGSVSILNSADGKRTAIVEMAGFPFAIAAITKGTNTDRKLYVTSEQKGTVSVIDPTTAKVISEITTGAQPMGLLLDKSQQRLFVVNASSDTVSILDTTTDKVIGTVLLRPDDARGLAGATPTNLTLSPDERTLYVTLADMNAVAVVDVAKKQVQGYIPVGWYPTAVVVSPDGKRLLVSNAKGVAERNPNGKPKPGIATRGQYIQNIIEGTVSTLEVPNSVQLAQQTKLVLENNLTNLVKKPAPFTNPGIKHVIYIIKENRTYDQVLGDLEKGNGDKSLVLFGRDITPNQHALAERFVTLDNFYCSAEVSGDGWNWSTSGMANEYVARNVPHGYGGRNRQYDYEGQNNGVAPDLTNIPDVGTAPGGYIWDAAAKAGVSYRNYGFFNTFGLPDEIKPFAKSSGIAIPNENDPTKRALVGKTSPDFLKYDLTYADSEAWVKQGVTPAPKQRTEYGKYKDPARTSTWMREYNNYVKNGGMPKFMFLRLGRNHTSGTSAGASSARAMVADNDYAVGQIVETVSKTPYWNKTAIFVVEDDAQNGFDHVDAHRSISFVISPYIRKGTLDSRFYNTDSTLHTICRLLKMQPMNQYVAVAPTFGIFGAKPENNAPYAAILPAKEIIGEVNNRSAYRAADSERLISNVREESLPDEELNDILWHSIKGVHTPAPARRYSIRTVVEKD